MLLPAAGGGGWGSPDRRVKRLYEVGWEDNQIHASFINFYGLRNAPAARQSTGTGVEAAAAAAVMMGGNSVATGPEH